MPSRSSYLYSVSFDLYNLVGRTTTPNIATLGFSDVDQILLPQFVNHARNHVSLAQHSLQSQILYFGQNVVPMLSIGGYTGSRWFSSHVRTNENRTAFAKTVADVVHMYNFGGVDFE
jgi:chitinase